MSRNPWSCRQFGFRLGVSIWVLVPALLLAVAQGAIAAPEDVIENTVSGSGDSLNEARMDAMARAVQQSFEQLIIVDRVIEDDELTRDRILATFNGFVTGFRLLRSTEAADGSIEIEAAVSVSQSGMRNFLVYGDRARAGVDGESLFAEMARARQHARVVDDILRRSLAGFPSHAYSVSLRSVELDHRNQIRLAIDVEGEPVYFNAIRDTLRLVSDRFIGFQPTPFDRFPSHRHLHMHLSGQTLCLANAPMFNPEHQVVVHCGLLPAGEYFGWLHPLQTVGLDRDAALVLALVDEHGRSLVPTTSGCWVQRQPVGFGNRFPFRIEQDAEGRHLVLAPIRAGMELHVPDDGVDLVRVRHLVGMVALVPRSGNGLVPDLTGAAMSARETCDYLLQNHSPLLANVPTDSYAVEAVVAVMQD